MYIWAHKKIFTLLLIILLFISGCGGGSQTVSTENSIQTATQSTELVTQTTESINKIIHQGQVKDYITGRALKDVKVTINNISTTTDTNGSYIFKDLNASNKVTINFSKNGYLFGSTQIQLNPNTTDDNTITNYLEYDLYPHDYQFNRESTQAISSPRINISNSVSFMTTDGKPYNGTRIINLTIIDDSEKAIITNFPGSFEGINTNGTIVQFETYGLITLIIKDDKGHNLTFSNGDLGTLIFQPSLSIKREVLPLWYYNYNKGIWVEEGYAQLQDDGTYKGEISHPGTWSLNKPIETDCGIYRGRIIDKNGLPKNHVRINAIGKNWIGKDLSTDSNGVFEIKVIPDSNFKLTAYDYKNKYGAVYNGTIDAISSGDIVEN